MMPESEPLGVPPLHYRDIPASTPTAAVPDEAVVLIHGWCCDLSDWDPVSAAMSRLGRLIALDLPGHGRSPDSEAGYSLSAMAASVLALLDHLHLGRVVIVGHSAGAEVAMTIALREPERVRAVIAVEPAYGALAADRDRLRALSQELAGPEAVETVTAYFERIDAACDVPDPLAQRHQRSARRCRPHVAAEMFREFTFGANSFHFSPDTEAVLGRRTVPLQAFYRSRERAEIGYSGTMHAGDSLHMYAGSGHWLHQERPERFVDDVETWLRGLSRREVADFQEAKRS